MSADSAGARLGPPIKVSPTDSAGRGVFAIRSIDSGELIHTAKPLLTHPSFALSDQSCCYYCLRKLNKDASNISFSTGKGEIGSSYSFCSKECRDESKGFFEVESKVDWSFYHDYCRFEQSSLQLMFVVVENGRDGGSKPLNFFCLFMGIEYFVYLDEFPDLAQIRTKPAAAAAEEEERAAAVTPKAEGSRLMPSAVCPPAPRKRRQAKRKSVVMPPPQGFCSVPKDLASVFLALPSKKLRI